MFVTVKPDLSVAVGEDVIARETLTATLDAATKGDKNERIYLRADKTGVRHGEAGSFHRVGEDVIARDTLTATLDSATMAKDERIFLRADKAVSYGDLMEVMNLLRNAGYLKIALVGLDGRS